MGPTIHKLRNTAAALGIDLSEDVPELTQGNREFLFTKEVREAGIGSVCVVRCDTWLAITFVR